MSALPWCRPNISSVRSPISNWVFGGSLSKLGRGAKFTRAERFGRHSELTSERRESDRNAGWSVKFGFFDTSGVATCN